MQMFAGYESVPVVAQSLGILSAFGLSVINDENIDAVPPEAIVLAACSKSARFPSKFLRRMPEGLELRRKELSYRGLEIPEQVLAIPRLVLVRPHRSGDGRYSAVDLDRFTIALRDLAGIKPPKVARNRGRNAHTRREGGIQPYLAH